MRNVLVVSENGRQQTVELDARNIWEVGRPYKDNSPDIKLYTTTVSRKHGSFQNIDGIWFYIDNHRRNGTAYNGRLIDVGINGRVKPVILKDGDELIFGCGRSLIQREESAKAKFLIMN